MTNTNGYLIISLDFELLWGVRDVKTKASYNENIVNVRNVIPRLINLADKYGIKLNFATVGFLFAHNKVELLKALPKLKPTYINPIFNPYNDIERIGDFEANDPFHYASSLIDLINSNKNHEIATHTFSHYYVNETGQTTEQFENDLTAAISIAKKKDISFKSIVFPRNQINDDYLKICAKHGILSFRGIEKHWMFDTSDTKKLESPLRKIFRLMDAYVNLSGYNTYPVSQIKPMSGVLNIPSSKFFRPYINFLKLFESIRINRINKGLTHAAKNNEVYHLWWHPHNFGSHTDENFRNLEKIFKHYANLNKDYNLNSISMTEMANKINS